MLGNKKLLRLSIQSSIELSSSEEDFDADDEITQTGTYYEDSNSMENLINKSQGQATKGVKASEPMNEFSHKKTLSESILGDSSPLSAEKHGISSNERKNRQSPQKKKLARSLTNQIPNNSNKAYFH